MKNLFLLVLAFGLLLGTATNSHADKKDALKALVRLKSNVEQGVNERKFNELVSDAETEINMLEDNKENKSYKDRAEFCLAFYQVRAFSDGGKCIDKLKEGKSSKRNL